LIQQLVLMGIILVQLGGNTLAADAEPGSYGSNEAAGKTGNIAPSTYDANDLGTDAARAGSTYPAGHPFSAGAAFAGNQSFCCW